MLTVDKFLCCLTLETGGLIIGWITFIGCILSAILSLVSLILFVGVIECADLLRMLDSHGGAEDCSIARGVIFGILVVALLLFIIFAVIGRLCIKGTQNRIHSKVKPMVILLAISAIASILNVFAFTTSGIVSGIVSAIVDAYCFVAIYSLYKVLREENGRGNINK